jgi:hypothetical protein
VQKPEASQVHAFLSSDGLCGRSVLPVPANAVSMSFGMLPERRLAAKLARPAIARRARRHTAEGRSSSRTVTSQRLTPAPRTDARTTPRETSNDAI